MARFSNEDKYNLLKCFHLRNDNANLAKELYYELYPEKPQPEPRIFKKLKMNLINHGSFSKPRPKTYYKQNREEQENAVLEYVRQNANTSSRKMEVDLNVKRNKALRVLKKHKFRPYKIRINHHLFPADFERRLEFCNWYIRKCNEDPDFQNFIIWTDESFISSDGIFNRYNNHIWSENNPHATATTNRQGRYGFSVWCGLLNDRLIGPHFFDNHLNSISYINILDNNLEQHLENIPLANRIRIYFQQDGAPAHNSRQAGEYLTRLFREKWIGTNGPIHWPPRSCDITPLDFWLWGYLKNIIYQERTNNIEELKERTRMAFQAITPVMIRNATTAVFSRCRACIAAEGRQFQHLR